MVEVPKLLNVDEFNIIAGSYKFNRALLCKDYFLTLILFLIKDVKGIYFKGGTALQKIFLNYSRLSEDIDLTLSRDISVVEKEIKNIIEASNLFIEVTKDKDVDGFRRMIIFYKNFNGLSDTIFIDLNAREKIIEKTERYKINHFYYPSIANFEFPTLSRNEIVAGKVAASIGRNKPRDHYDIYRIIKENIKIDLNLVKKKCSSSGVEFNIERIFIAGNKLYKRWNNDLSNLLVEEITFQEVMKTLATHFNLKDEKEKIK
jgi:predicted nucleotidyltransferase component of viral defense system